MRYALVTGGSRGIGRNICFKLAQMGFTVIINYVSNDSEAQKTLDELAPIELLPGCTLPYPSH